MSLQKWRQRKATIFPEWYKIRAPTEARKRVKREIARAETACACV
jgi:hypothetical protein